jgi:hypothetical protein
MLVHKGLFRIAKEADGFGWFRANGTRIPQAPRQPRGDCQKLSGSGNTPRRTAWSLYPVEPTPRGAMLGWCVEELADRRAARLE